jgi:hypothetical protein
MGIYQVILSKNSETYQLLAKEALEFMLDCLNQGMQLNEIKAMYINEMGSIPISYGNILNQLIKEHLECHKRLVNKNN